MKFNIKKFKEAAKGRLNIENIDIVKELKVIYIDFENSNISHIKATINHKEKYNCINIYHSGSTKNGYWWDGELDYNELVDEILKYEIGGVYQCLES